MDRLSAAGGPLRFWVRIQIGNRMEISLPISVASKPISVARQAGMPGCSLAPLQQQAQPKQGQYAAAEPLQPALAGIAATQPTAGEMRCQ